MAAAASLTTIVKHYFRESNLSIMLGDIPAVDYKSDERADHDEKPRENEFYLLVPISIFRNLALSSLA